MHRILATLAGAIAMSIAFQSHAYTVYVTNEKGNTLTVLDSETWEVTGTYDAGQRPRGITISPDGKELYVCASDDDTVRVFDTATMEMTHTLPSGEISIPRGRWPTGTSSTTSHVVESITVTELPFSFEM